VGSSSSDISGRAARSLRSRPFAGDGYCGKNLDLWAATGEHRTVLPAAREMSCRNRVDMKVESKSQPGPTVEEEVLKSP